MAVNMRKRGTWPTCERGHADCRTPRACQELARCDRQGCEHGKEA